MIITVKDGNFIKYDNFSSAGDNSVVIHINLDPVQLL